MRKLVGGCALMVLLCGCGGKKLADADLYNVQAGLNTPAAKDQPPGTQGSGLPYPVMEWRVMTTVVDRGAETTSTLFGNDAAVGAARAGMAYPSGAVLGLVTWQQRDDPHWFGARIPGTPMMAEFVVVGAANERKFVGSPWREVAGDVGRVAEIEGMKAAVAP